MPDCLLEVRGADGAFECVQDWLRERGFFAPGGESLVAEIYLGYGLSQTIRRTSTPPPAEPCAALPLAACRLLKVFAFEGRSLPPPLEEVPTLRLTGVLEVPPQLSHSWTMTLWSPFPMLTLVSSFAPLTL